MRQSWIVRSLLVFIVSAHVHRAISQANAAAAEGTSPYNLSVSVDEVILTFHAADSHGLAINDLKLDELTLLDNDRPPHKIIAFQLRQDLPIRAGVLIDPSESTEGQLSENRAISIKYAQRLLRQRTDQALIMDFGYISKITQPWTSDPTALTTGIARVIAGRENPRPGTALFDALYRACLYEFGGIDHAASANFILLFSDGEDNAGRTSLSDVVDICQHANTAIYSFRTQSKSDLFSIGPKTLADLVSETGGRVFYGDDSSERVDIDLRTIETDLRSQYRIIYKAAQIRHDGSFHRIELKTPERVDSLSIRSGYYAPAH